MAEYKTFISYSHADGDSQELAEALTKQLQRAGVPVWQDTSNSTGGSWQDEIEKQLDELEIFIILLTPEGLKSPWINFELGVAASRSDARIIPVILNGVTVDKLPKFLRERPVIDGSKGSTLEISEQIADGVVALSQ